MANEPSVLKIPSIWVQYKNVDGYYVWSQLKDVEKIVFADSSSSLDVRVTTSTQNYVLSGVQCLLRG